MWLLDIFLVSIILAPFFAFFGSIDFLLYSQWELTTSRLSRRVIGLNPALIFIKVYKIDNRNLLLCVKNETHVATEQQLDALLTNVLQFLGKKDYFCFFKSTSGEPRKFFRQQQHYYFGRKKSWFLFLCFRMTLWKFENVESIPGHHPLVFFRKYILYGKCQKNGSKLYIFANWKRKHTFTTKKCVLN